MSTKVCDRSNRRSLYQREPPVRMGGPVVKGFGRGSKVLGIPTANLDVSPLKFESDSLAPGIYFGWAGLKGAQGRGLDHSFESRVHVVFARLEALFTDMNASSRPIAFR